LSWPGIGGESRDQMGVQMREIVAQGLIVHRERHVWFGRKGAVMTATLDGATRKIKKELLAEEQLAADLVARAREQGVSLTGPDGLLKQLTKTVPETALNRELTEHLGHEKHDRAGNDTGNLRNGVRAKSVLTESSGELGISVPRDRDRTFEPQIVRKRGDSVRHGLALGASERESLGRRCVRFVQHRQQPRPAARAARSGTC
jgi:hypothetical protein